MELSGDPKVVYLAERTKAFGKQVNRDGDTIRTLRRELDALWVSRRSSNGGVVWVLRQRQGAKPLRSA